MEHVQIGMKSRGGPGLRLNRRQESNLLHMHRVIDRYLTTTADRTAPAAVAAHSVRYRPPSTASWAPFT